MKTETIILLGISFLWLLACHFWALRRDLKALEKKNSGKDGNPVQNGQENRVERKVPTEKATGGEQKTQEVRTLTEEEKKLLLERIREEYKSAEFIEDKELEDRARDLINSYLCGSIHRDDFTQAFRVIHSNVQRMILPDEDGCITMNPDWPMWLIEFCGQVFQSWSVLEEYRKAHALTLL